MKIYTCLCGGEKVNKTQAFIQCKKCGSKVKKQKDKTLEESWNHVNDIQGLAEFIGRDPAEINRLRNQEIK